MIKWFTKKSREPRLSSYQPWIQSLTQWFCSRVPLSVSLTAFPLPTKINHFGECTPHSPLFENKIGLQVHDNNGESH